MFLEHFEFGIFRNIVFELYSDRFALDTDWGIWKNLEFTIFSSLYVRKLSRKDWAILGEFPSWTELKAPHKSDETIQL